MIEGLKPYADYHDSGERWIEEIPTSWQLRRAKFLFREIDERSKTGKEELLSVSHKTGVTPRSQKSVTMFLAESNVGHKICRPQDLVINTLWAWMAALGVSKHTGIVSPAYGVYRLIDPEKFLPRFADLLLRTPMYAAEYQRRSTGVNSSRLRLYAEYFFRIPAILPPPDEQAAIVRFLDHANRKIDGFIRAKRKLIGLLNEQKQAIIHRAVTRGLDSNARLKPSGIPWPGEIPAHWDLRKLRRVAWYQEGPGLRTWQFTPTGVQVICVTNITAYGIDLNLLNRCISRDEYSQKYKHFTVQRGDILLASSGNSWGKVAEFTGDEVLILNTSTIRLNVARYEKVTNSFLKLLLQSEYIRQQLQSLLTGSCQPNFGPSHLDRVWVTFPPDRTEQDAIVTKVNLQLGPIETAITRTEREIALMQEYRTRLTADIVTGKLDVREAAAKLPEPVAEEAADSEIAEEETELEEVEE